MKISSVDAPCVGDVARNVDHRRVATLYVRARNKRETFASFNYADILAKNPFFVKG